MTTGTITTVGIPDEVKVRLEVDTRGLVEKANALEIKTEQTNTEAAKFTAALKAEIKSRKTILAPSKAALDAQKSAYNGLVATMIDPLDECVDIVSGKIGAFVKAENARRAELQRIEDEKVAAAQRKEEERIARLNEKAAAAGKPAPVITPKIIPTRTIAAVTAPAGTSYQTRWSAKVVNLKAVCLAVAEGRLPEHAVAAAMPYFNALAVAKKAEGEVAPGVVAVSTVGPTQRTV